MSKLVVLLLALALAIIIGPLAWNYVALLFSLPQLTIWQFLVAGVAMRCLLGTTK